MMRPLRIVLQDPQNCQSYHLMYAAAAKMSLASIQLDKMISSNACTVRDFDPVNVLCTNPSMLT
jgi:hypothetical protein